MKAAGDVAVPNERCVLFVCIADLSQLNVTLLAGAKHTRAEVNCVSAYKVASSVHT